MCSVLSRCDQAGEMLARDRLRSAVRSGDFNGDATLAGGFRYGIDDMPERKTGSPVRIREHAGVVACADDRSGPRCIRDDAADLSSEAFSGQQLLNATGNSLANTLIGNTGPMCWAAAQVQTS